MTDFAELIEKAIERDVRSQLLAFLSEHRHVEFGRPRELTLDEAAMVLTCVDEFMARSNMLSLGVSEIEGLREQLSQLADTPMADYQSTPVSNACIDALACITALEARLSSMSNWPGLSVRVRSLSVGSANDP